MDAFAMDAEQRRHRVLREPVDLKAGMQRAEFPRNRDVAPAMAQADGRGEIKDPLRLARARPCCHLWACRLSFWAGDAQAAIEKIEDQRVAFCRAAAQRIMAA